MATLLTLVVIPVVYSLVDRRSPARSTETETESGALPEGLGAEPAA